MDISDELVVFPSVGTTFWVGIRDAKDCTSFCQSCSSGPLIPVTKTLPSATLTNPFSCRILFIIGMRRWHLPVSPSEGIRSILLSGLGHNSVTITAYLVPRCKSAFFKKCCISPMGLPNRPGELNIYKSAGIISFGLTSRT